MSKVFIVVRSLPPASLIGEAYLSYCYDEGIQAPVIGLR
jgi:hypothetical protein